MQYVYIMFEGPVNKQYAGKQKERVKLAEREGKSLKIKGDIDDNIMANGFSWQLKARTANGRSSEHEIENDKLSGRVSFVWNEHLFNESALAVQPLIVVQGPYIRWPLRRFARVGKHKHSGETEGSSLPHIEALQNILWFWNSGDLNPNNGKCDFEQQLLIKCRGTNEYQDSLRRRPIDKNHKNKEFESNEQHIM
eukprot:11357914-Heterocapsa_arctica.AAC.1